MAAEEVYGLWTQTCAYRAGWDAGGNGEFSTEKLQESPHVTFLLQ